MLEYRLQATTTGRDTVPVRQLRLRNHNGWMDIRAPGGVDNNDRRLAELYRSPPLQARIGTLRNPFESVGTIA
jgi:hypothetical protein